MRGHIYVVLAGRLIISLVLALGLCVALSGCTQSGDNPAASAQPDESFQNAQNTNAPNLSSQELQPQNTQQTGSSAGTESVISSSDAPASADQDTAPAAQVSDSKVIACLGDSITYGIGAGNAYNTDSWPAVLESLLGDGYTVHNFGVPGACITDGTFMPYRELGCIESALELDPGVIIMMFGSNDSRADSWNPEGYRASYAQVIEQLRTACPQASIVLMSPPMTYEEEIYQGPAYEIADNTVIRNELIPILKDLVNTYNLEYIDLYGFTDPHREWYVDGLHLSSEGYRAVAAYVYEQLR